MSEEKTPASPTKPAEKDSNTLHRVLVHCKNTETRMRTGRLFSQAPITVDVSAAELARLKADPYLVVKDAVNT